MKTVEEILIDLHEVGDVVRGQLGVTHWRAIAVLDERTNPLHPDLVVRRLPSGTLRPADVETYTRDGVPYVRAQPRVGTSVVDKPGIFGDEGWQYLRIPAGTEIPPELTVTRDHWMKRHGARHYSICPNTDMPVHLYLRALDRLARNAGLRLTQGDTNADR